MRSGGEYSCGDACLGIGRGGTASQVGYARKSHTLRQPKQRSEALTTKERSEAFSTKGRSEVLTTKERSETFSTKSITSVPL